MPKKLLVSVHMITYNHELYIAQAIECVINQKTTFPFELVIGEDCSTDNTRKIVLDYRHKHPDIIKVISSEVNVGMHKNSYRTTMACTGKYIAYCEGDDYWHDPNKLQIQVDFLENNQDYVMVHSNANSILMENNKLKSKYVVYSPLFDDSSAFYDILTGNRSICTCTVCANKDLIVKVIKENYECCDPQLLMGDLQLWLEISRLGKVFFINNALSTYRILAESMSNSMDVNKKLNFSHSAHELRIYYLAKYNCSNDIVKKVVAKYTLDLFKLAIWANNREIADKAFNCLLKFNIDPALNLVERLSYWGLRGKLNGFIINILKSLYRQFNSCFRNCMVK